MFISMKNFIMSSYIENGKTCCHGNNFGSFYDTTYGKLFSGIKTLEFGKNHERMWLSDRPTEREMKEKMFICI